MSVSVWIGVALLGGVGAVMRFLVDGYISSRIAPGWPSGTFVINVSGSFALGLLDAMTLNGTVAVLVGSATVGAYTTFSTWMLETHRLREDAQFGRALTNVVVSFAAGLGAAALGHVIGVHA